MKLFAHFYSFFLAKNPYTEVNFLVFFRVALGLFLCIYIGVLYPDFDLLFFDNPALTSQEQRVFQGSSLINADQILDFLSRFNLSEVFSKKLIYGTLVLSSIALILGFYTQVFSILFLFLWNALTGNAEYFTYGLDSFMRISLFYLVIFPSDRYGSIRNQFTFSKDLSFITPFRRLLQVHLALSYFFEGLNKAISVDWWNGESVWKALHLYYYQKEGILNWSELGPFPLLFAGLGVGIVLLELLFPFFIFWSKTRKWALWAIVGMHLFIFIQFELYFFSILMLILNITAYGFIKKRNESKYYTNH